MMYSVKFKERMVRRMVGPRALSATALSKEVGINQSTLSRWLRDSVAGTVDRDKEQKEKMPSRGERAPLEKAELVIEASKLKGDELGAFLRKNGLHEADLEQMRAWLRDRLDPKQPSRSDEKAAKKAQQAGQKRIRTLERELRKKEKALAEAAALLVLQKKVQRLWGAEGDDTDPTSED